MTEFTLHGIPGSPYVRAVALTLEEKRVRWTLAAIPMGAHRAPDYLAVHPFQKIPTLDHGDFRLYETHAILRYLDRVCPGASLVPDDPRQAARVDQLISLTNDYVAHQVSAVLSYNRRIVPLLGGMPDEAAVASGIEPARRVLAELARLLGDRPFFAGETLSLGDLMVAPHLSFLPEYGEGRNLLAERPNLAAWLERMETRASMQATSWDALIAKTGVDTKRPIAAAA
ncbi:glutathione S-transferase family protein [Sphingomonas sp. GlSt437]|uniref:glutathione S-transferase family protein n=1 Tax=Sphingomonas sp. GlSt437 TaxID=3389970 RepID=UPI003A85E42A